MHNRQTRPLFRDLLAPAVLGGFFGFLFAFVGAGFASPSPGTAFLSFGLGVASISLLAAAERFPRPVRGFKPVLLWSAGGALLIAWWWLTLFRHVCSPLLVFALGASLIAPYAQTEKGFHDAKRNAYVFARGKFLLTVLKNTTLIALVAYILRDHRKVAICIIIFLIVRFMAHIEEIEFSDEEMVIKNSMKMKFSVGYDEVWKFGTRYFKNGFFIIALEMMLIPIYFTGESKHVPEILSKMETATGKKIPGR